MAIILSLCSFSSLQAQQKRFTKQLFTKIVAKRNTNCILEDSNGIIWYGGSGLFKYVGNKSVNVLHSTLNGDSIKLGTINVIYEDQKGRIWIGTTNGLFNYNRETNLIKESFPHFFKTRLGNKSIIYSIFEDSASRLWVGGEDRIFLIPFSEGEKNQIIEDFIEEPKYQSIRGVRKIVEDKYETIYFATSRGLLKLNENLTTTFLALKTAKPYFCFDIILGYDNNLWLATNNGLRVYNINEQQFDNTPISNKLNTPIRSLLFEKDGGLWLVKNNGLVHQLPNGKIETYNQPDFHYIDFLHKDRFGNLWIGSLSHILYLPLATNEKFPFYAIEGNKKNTDNYINRLIQDKNGGFWFRLLRTGLGYTSGLDATFEVRLQPDPNHYIEEIKDFCVDVDSNVWVITLSHGLYLFEKGKMPAKYIELGDSVKLAQPLRIIADSKDNQILWFSSKFGLCAVNRHNYTHKWFHPKRDLPFVDRNGVGQISQSDDGNIWLRLLINEDYTLSYFDKKQNVFVINQTFSDSTRGVRMRELISASRNKIAAASSKGMFFMDISEQRINNFFNPLSFQSVAQDQDGHFWFTEKNKVYKYDGQKFSSISIPSQFGNFVGGSSIIANAGYPIFGCQNGMLLVNPEKMKKDMLAPKVILNGLAILNKPKNLGKSLENIHKIELPFKENSIGLAFSALHFLQEENIQYKYKLENFQDDWIEPTSNQPTASYNNLAPGIYYFKAIAANADGVWTPESKALNIKLSILPPWYRTTWAYLLWITLIGSLAYWFYRFQLNRQLEKAEAFRLKEMDEVKTKLYTNITHEFRTPLTVINGIAKKLQGQVDFSVREGLNLIGRNGQQLLNLVNQMLDLSKLESGHLDTNMEQGDIILFLNYLLESFHSLAESKKIILHFETSHPHFLMDFDTEKIRQIINNLLQNAIKFTPTNGQVYLRVKEDNQALYVEVEDTGVGIPPHQLEKIFDRFYQVDDSATRKGEGTGIGLTLTKELVKLLGGNIEVESQFGKGSRFYFTLPVTQNAEIATHAVDKKKAVHPTDIAEKPSNVVVRQSILPTNKKPISLLIIEDNADVVRYLSMVVPTNYQISTATNGKAGLVKAQKDFPDIIICDVMMPEMNGYEVCKQLKADLSTSHIPIILLTAKADFDSKIEGLAQGADAYLTKPFQEQELNLRLEKLLANRKKLQEYYTSKIFKDQSSSAMESANQLSAPDKAFMQQLLQIMEENFKNPSFSADNLCSLLFVSYSTCLRKVKNITGMGVTEYIHHYRLQKAALWLREQPEKTILQIALALGYNSQSYFNRVFKKHFGCTPSQFREKTT